MVRRFAAFVALLALVLPAAAAADPPWSATQNLSSPHLFVDPVDVTSSGDGTALAWWAWQDGIGTSARSGWSLASRGPGAATFGAQRAAPSGTVGIAGFAQTRAVALINQAIGPANLGRTRLRVAFGRTSGSFETPRTIADGPRLNRPVLAVNARGDAAVAYFEDRGVTNDRVMISLRRAGGRFGTPFQVAHGRIRSVAVAVGERGDILVAWDARGTIQARYRPSFRPGFDPIETIKSEPTYFAQMRAAVADAGRCYLAWSAQFLSEGGSRGPVFNEVAVRPSGHRFRAAQLLERDDETRSQEPIALATQGRDATVAWTGFDGANARVRTASTDPSARFGAPQDVSPAGRDGVVSDLAAAGATRLVVWDNGGFDANQVFAAVAAPGGPFGAAEAVSAAQEARAGRALLAGRPTTVWTNRPTGSHPPGGLNAVQTFAQAATR
ncbi:MAG TPA: hypothetical protein VH834_20465 [Solirubrobacteraceae bacterium]|jgi:hypothetical protein